MSHDIELTTKVTVPLDQPDLPNLNTIKREVTKQANQARADNGLPPITLTFTVTDTHLTTQYVRQVITD